MKSPSAKGINILRRLRPKLTLKEDEFAFLAPLHPRRVELPTNLTQEAFSSLENARSPNHQRRYALVFPAETADRVDERLRQNLPARGWHPGRPAELRWLHQGKPIRLGTGGLVPDAVFLAPIPDDYRSSLIKEGERMIVIQLNISKT